MSFTTARSGALLGSWTRNRSPRTRLNIGIPKDSARRSSTTAGRPSTRLLSFRGGATITTAAITLALFYTYYKDTRSAIHPFTSNFFRLFDPETLHHFAITAGRTGFWPKERVEDDSVLEVQVAGKVIKNPIGLAAGWDKDGVAIPGLFGLGFGAVEVGSVTLRPQSGNAKPRVFRLRQDDAVINRYGFPSSGVAPMRTNLRAASQSQPSWTLLGINLGRNKDTPPSEEVAEFVELAQATARHADYLVINVSSPNTPGLRKTLEEVDRLEALIAEVKRAATLGAERKQVWLKVSPDLDDDGLKRLGDVAMKAGVDGLVVTNTTISRPQTLQSDPHLVNQKGGLSGPPLKPLALHCVRLLHNHTNGAIPIIGSGGIKNAQDCIDYARAGASMVQIYTAITTDGLGTVTRIKSDLAKELKGMGVRWSDLIGQQGK